MSSRLPVIAGLASGALVAAGVLGLAVALAPAPEAGTAAPTSPKASVSLGGSAATSPAAPSPSGSRPGRASHGPGASVRAEP